jgi:hypothetical protein
MHDSRISNLKIKALDPTSTNRIQTTRKTEVLKTIVQLADVRF